MSKNLITHKMKYCISSLYLFQFARFQTSGSAGEDLAAASKVSFLCGNYAILFHH